MQGALRRGCQGLACSHRSQQRSRHQPVFGCSREPGALKSFCSAPLRRPLQSAPCFAHVCGLARPLKAARPRRCKPVSARSNSSPEVTDRLLAALPYLVPLFDGLRYGKFLFLQFPFFSQVLAPLDPLIRLYFSFPFASLVVFFAIYAGLVNNQRFPRFVRYNGMQAILLDIVLVLPGLLESLFRPPMSGPGLQLYINAYNSVWVFVFVCVAYAVGSCLAGSTARLPLIADAADQQVR